MIKKVLVRTRILIRTLPKYKGLPFSIIDKLVANLDLTRGEASRAHAAVPLLIEVTLYFMVALRLGCGGSTAMRHSGSSMSLLRTALETIQPFPTSLGTFGCGCSASCGLVARDTASLTVMEVPACMKLIDILETDNEINQDHLLSGQSTPEGAG